MADFSQLEQEISEDASAKGAAITLLQDLKKRLDAAGTDPVKLKELSDSLSAATDGLAQAVVDNTPAA